MKTRWFHYQTKPVRAGVYEVRTTFTEEVEYAYWDGLRWGWLHTTVKQADRYRTSNGAMQNKTWRGLLK